MAMESYFFSFLASSASRVSLCLYGAMIKASAMDLTGITYIGSGYGKI